MSWMSWAEILYSGLFVRFAWAVQPRNYILASCHTANVLAQGNQLRRPLSMAWMYVKKSNGITHYTIYSIYMVYKYIYGI